MNGVKHVYPTFFSFTFFHATCTIRGFQNFNSNMRWWLYNILFCAAYTLMTPWFAFRMARRGGYRARFGERFGRYSPEVRARLETPGPQFCWIHAVSVGEVYAAAQIMRALRERDASIRFVLSTTSSTGFRVAEKEARENDVTLYCPLDFPWCVRRALRAIQPRCLILTESEIWPNLIRQCAAANIPVFLVNARVSDRSAPRYKFLRFWFGPVFQCFTRIIAQSETDRQRLVDAGADAASITVTGSVKFDAVRRDGEKEKSLAAFLSACGMMGNGRVLLLGGSTWPGEDAALLGIYAGLRPKHPGLRLAIVPRHFEKADAVEAAIQQRGFACLRKSRMNAPPAQPDENAVLLADTTGELAAFYGCADIAFVGRSLCAHGGQNMIEPCLCGVATVVGPWTENFRPVMSDLLAQEALWQVRDVATLREAIERLVASPAIRHELGKRGREAVEHRKGAAGVCAEMILK